MAREILNTRNYKAGYVIRTEKISGEEAGGGEDFEIKSAYTFEGCYIGNSKDAHFLCKKRGIKPELSDDNHNVCSIGFCEKEQKWYGWSHRAIFGFGVGSSVKKGDCGYVPTDEEDFIQDSLRFWNDKWHDKIKARKMPALDESGNPTIKGVEISWTNSEDTPNKDSRGKISSLFDPFPDEYGRGEWTAETLEDAKEMAIDFARGVS